MTFPTTRWSLILASSDESIARAAWAELATRYRSAILAWFRARYDAACAEDLTQAFFAASIEGDWWSRADSGRGSFRTYLRVMLHRFGERHAGGREAALEDAALVPDSGLGPDAAYERDFASALVARAFQRLAKDQLGDDQLMALVLERGDRGHLKALAIQLGIPQNTLAQRLRRLRLRLRDLVRQEFADLVDDPALVDTEVAAVMGGI